VADVWCARSPVCANWAHIPFEEAKMRRQFGAVYDWARKVVRGLRGVNQKLEGQFDQVAAAASDRSNRRYGQIK
jgi:hypothetical protein